VDYPDGEDFMRWIEVSMEVDGEAAEAVAEVLQRYGHQGVAIEQAGFTSNLEDEIRLPNGSSCGLFAEDERADGAKQQLEEALWASRQAVSNAHARI